MATPELVVNLNLPLKGAHQLARIFPKWDGLAILKARNEWILSTIAEKVDRGPLPPNFLIYFIVLFHRCWGKYLFLRALLNTL